MKNFWCMIAASSFNALCILYIGGQLHGHVCESKFPPIFLSKYGSPPAHFEYLRPEWSTPADFVHQCGEFDGSEHVDADAEYFVSPFLQPLAPLFRQRLSFRDAVVTLDAFAQAKERSIATVNQTCLPWNHFGTLDKFGWTFSRQLPYIAMFTTASKNSKNLFGQNYSQIDQATYDRAYNLSLEDKMKYCSRHGYDWHVFEDVVNGRSVGWSRIPAALSLLDRYDWIFYIDLDTVIMDHNAKLEELLDPRFDVIIGVDTNGINNGVFALRNSTWSRMLYAEAWTRADVPHSEYWFEQAALMEIMNESHGVRNHMKLVPQEHFNMYLSPNDTLPDGKYPFILHFPGRGDKWTMVERFMRKKRG